jgi:hypothetical protein
MRKLDNHQDKLKRQFDRNLLPEPFHYYRHEFPTFSMCGEWVQVHCCFHKDTKPSLSIHLVSGGFHCFACGAKGGDVIAFHCRRYAVSFLEAVSFLGAWNYVA